MRIGAKKRPFYKVVAVNEQAKRTGGYLELLGTYNPLTSPKEINLKQDRIDYWIKQGAQMTNGYLRIIGKAKQRLPQKAKKQKKAETPVVKGNTPDGGPPPGEDSSGVSKEKPEESEKTNEGSA